MNAQRDGRRCCIVIHNGDRCGLGAPHEILRSIVHRHRDRPITLVDVVILRGHGVSRTARRGNRDCLAALVTLRYVVAIAFRNRQTHRKGGRRWGSRRDCELRCAALSDGRRDCSDADARRGDGRCRRLGWGSPEDIYGCVQPLAAHYDFSYFP